MEKYIGKYSVKDFLYLILGAFIYSIGTHSFIETANIAPGGAVGVALMLNHVTNLPVGRLTLMVNVPLLILAWFHLSRAFALRTERLKATRRSMNSSPMTRRTPNIESA